jgi:hypothetical protein
MNDHAPVDRIVVRDASGGAITLLRAQRVP